MSGKPNRRTSIIASAKQSLDKEAAKAATPTQATGGEKEIAALESAKLVKRLSASLDTKGTASGSPQTAASASAATPAPASPLPAEDAAAIAKAGEGRQKAQQQENERRSTIHKEREFRRKSTIEEVSGLRKLGAKESEKAAAEAARERERLKQREKELKQREIEGAVPSGNRQRLVSAFAHALKRDSIIEDNVKGSGQYEERKLEAAVAVNAYKSGEEGSSPSSLDGNISATEGQGRKLRRAMTASGAVQGARGKKVSLTDELRKKAMTLDMGASPAKKGGSTPGFKKSPSKKPQANGKAHGGNPQNKQGYLLKKGGSKVDDAGRPKKMFTRHNWKTRYFVLDSESGLLSFYATKADHTALGTIALKANKGCQVDRVVVSATYPACVRACVRA